MSLSRRCSPLSSLDCARLVVCGSPVTSVKLMRLKVVRVAKKWVHGGAEEEGERGWSIRSLPRFVAFAHPMTGPQDWSGRGLSTHPSCWLAELDDIVFEVAPIPTALTDGGRGLECKMYSISSLTGQHLRARREGISEAKYRVLVKRGAPRRSVAQRLRSPLDARGRRGRDRRGRERGKCAVFYRSWGKWFLSTSTSVRGRGCATNPTAPAGQFLIGDATGD